MQLEMQIFQKHPPTSQNGFVTTTNREEPDGFNTSPSIKASLQTLRAPSWTQQVCVVVYEQEREALLGSEVLSVDVY